MAVPSLPAAEPLTLTNLIVHSRRSSRATPFRRDSQNCKNSGHFHLASGGSFGSCWASLHHLSFRSLSLRFFFHYGRAHRNGAERSESGAGGGGRPDPKTPESQWPGAWLSPGKTPATRTSACSDVHGKRPGQCGGTCRVAQPSHRPVQGPGRIIVQRRPSLLWRVGQSVGFGGRPKGLPIPPPPSQFFFLKPTRVMVALRLRFYCRSTLHDGHH